MPRSVIVRTACRLHFGLFALEAPPGAKEQRSFGGVGVMVSQTGIELHIREAAGFEVADDPLADRVRGFARRWAEFYSRPLAGMKLFLLGHTPDHVGLGTGTQLGLAVAAGLSAFHGLPVPPLEELCRSVGRGLRSAVGAYGFAYGGMIVDRGKLPGEFLSPLDCRLELPAEWRFVLARPLQGAGLAGEREQQAMDHANRNLDPLTEKLVTEARECLIPAAATGNFADFAASLGRYCELAGQFYIDVQGGPYNGPDVTALAERIRSLGHIGFGQSSWGPTLFVACENDAAADKLAKQLYGDDSLMTKIDVKIAQVCNQPARVEVHE
jgi:beta-ribofuranosylaminobenzene 5'-phosphate synthase